MTFRNILDPLIGSTLVDAKKLYASEVDSCIGIIFDFEKGSFVVLAVAENDSITIEAMVKEKSQFDELSGFATKVLDAPISGAHVGQTFVNYWFCENEPNYIDGIDLGLGDLNFPTIKLLCSLSEVLEFSVSR